MPDHFFVVSRTRPDSLQLPRMARGYSSPKCVLFATKITVEVIKVDRRGRCDGGALKSGATTRYPCVSLRVGPLLFAEADLGMLVSPLNQGAPMR